MNHVHPQVSCTSSFSERFAGCFASSNTASIASHYLAFACLLLVACGSIAPAARAAERVVVWGDDSHGQTDLPVGLNEVIALAGGSGHSLALRTDGTVVAWGDNSFGQTDVPAGVSNVVAVAAGSVNSLALRANGTVVAWGNNWGGQTNVPAGVSNVVAMAAGDLHSLALRAEGTVIAWGWNNEGQTELPACLSNVIAVAAGAMHSLALRGDGTVAAWGSSDFGQTNVPTGLSNVIAVAAGAMHSLALRGDGTVVAWGNSDFGQTNVPAGLSNVVAMAAGAINSLALRTDGTIESWGGNYPIGTNLFPIATPAGLSNVVAVAAGSSHCLALAGSPGGLAAPQLVGSRFLVGTMDGSFQYRIMALNGATSYGASGLPPGLVVNPITGLITGQPTQAGRYSVVLSATNVVGASQWTATLVVNPPLPGVQEGLIEAVFGVGLKYRLLSVNDPVFFAATGLPVDLAIDPSTGVISGTPLTSGDFPVSVLVSNRYGFATSLVTIRVRPKPVEYNFTNFAGLPGGSGNADGVGSAARFYLPSGVALDGAGNIYVADTWNCTVRKITPTGEVTTLVGHSGQHGYGDGSGSAARFDAPTGLAVDSTANVYVADTDNHAIRKITPTGEVTTLAGSAGQPGSTDGTGSAARFSRPGGVAVDSAGNIFVADTDNHTIRKINPAGEVTTLAGSAGQPGSADGTGSAARFSRPGGVAVDRAGNIFVADTMNCTIRKVTPSGDVTTLAGSAGQPGSTDETGSAVRFNAPSGVALDSIGNIYVADSGNNTIRRITPGGMVTTLAGRALVFGSKDGIGNAAEFDRPSGMAMDSMGNIYVADSYNCTIRRITPVGMVTTLTGSPGHSGNADGIASTARFSHPSGAAVDSMGRVYVADSYNHTIRKITPDGLVTTLAGRAQLSGSKDGIGSTAQFCVPTRVAVDSTGIVYVADSNNHTIRRITPSGQVTTLAGSPGQMGSADGIGSEARFNWPNGVTVDSIGNIYVADSGNNTIRRITPTGMVTTLAGSPGHSGNADGIASTARFAAPYDLAVDNTGTLYVADSGNDCIRKITPAGMVTTLAGTGPYRGSATAGRSPASVAVDSAGNVFKGNYYNQTIDKITPSGVVTTIGGMIGASGDSDGIGRAARFNGPDGIAVDREGTLYVADCGNNRITRGTPDWGARLSPVIIVQPKSPTVEAGTPVSIFVEAVGAMPLFYQWCKGSVAIPGATNFSYAIDSLQHTDAGNYLVLVGNAYGSITGFAELVLGLPPTITVQPQGTSAPLGGRTSFAVQAAGTAPLAYQWRKDGVDIPNATNFTYAIPTVQSSDAGSYSVRVANLYGTVVSSDGALVVGLPPTVTVQPQGTSTALGGRASFAVQATGTTPLSYQWRKNGVVILNATNSTYSIASVQGSDAGSYSVRVANSYGSVVSSDAALVLGLPPTITIQPQGTSAPLGGRTSFAVQAAGTAPLAYQWRKDGVDIPNATNFTYAIPTVQSSDAGSYSVRVANLYGTVVSSDGTLVVGLPPTVTVQPQGTSTALGGRASFAVQATGTTPLSYQWRKNGVVILNATSSTYSIASVQGSDVGSYSVRVANSYGSVVSSDAALVLGLPPTITVQPQGTSAPLGGRASFAVQATGTTPLAYQWRKDGVGISTATNSTYAIASVQGDHAGSYSVRVTNLYGAVVSSDAVLVVGLPPAITVQPQNTSVTLSGSASLAVQATGTEPLYYQWRKNGVVIPNATNSTFAIASVQSGDVASYSVRVANNYGAVVSSDAAVTLALPPVITVQPQDVTAGLGGNASFWIQATGSTPLGCQWQFNGANLSDGNHISGAATTSLSLTKVERGHAGSYSVVVTNAYGSATSSVARLSVPIFPPVLSGPTLQSNAFKCFVGPGSFAGGVLVMQTAADLTPPVTWKNLAVVDLPSGGTGAFTDPDATDYLRYYRAKAILSDGTESYSVNTLGYVRRVMQTGTNLVSNPFNTQDNRIGSLLRGCPDGSILLKFNGYEFSVAAYSWDIGVWDQPSMTLNPGEGAIFRNPDARFTLAFVGEVPQGSLVNSIAGTLLEGSMAPVNGLFDFPAGSDQSILTWDALQKTYVSHVFKDGEWDPVVLLRPGEAFWVTASTPVNWIQSFIVNTLPAVETPFIYSQPASREASTGTSATFSVSVTGTGPLAYQWRFEGTDLEGATNSTYTIASVQTSDGGQYSVQVTGAYGTVVSSNATLVVTAPPLITSQPQSRMNQAGSTATFTVVATGSEPLTYQWRFNGANLSDRQGIAGSTSTNLTISSVRPTDAGDYSVVVTNAYGSITSQVAMLTVLDVGTSTWAGSDDFSGGISSTNWTFYPNNTGEVRVLGTNGHASFIDPGLITGEDKAVAIVWHGNPTAAEDWTVAVSGHNSATPSQLQLAVARTDTAGTSNQEGYRISMARGSASQRFNVKEWIHGDEITRAATNATSPDFGLRLVYHSGTRMIEAWYDPEASGQGWTVLDTISLAEFSPTMAASNTFLFIVNAVANHDYGPITEGQLWADGFCLTSQTGLAPVLTAQPADQTVSNGSTVSLAVGVVGTPPFYYLWHKEGAVLKDGGNIAGVTTTNLTITSVQPADGGNYFVVVTNAYGSVTSTGATLTVVGSAQVDWQGCDNFSTGSSATNWTLVPQALGQMTLQVTNGHASFFDPISTTDHQRAIMMWNGRPKVAEGWMVDVLGRNTVPHGDGGSSLYLVVLDTAAWERGQISGFTLGMGQHSSGSSFGSAWVYPPDVNVDRVIVPCTNNTLFGLRLLYEPESQTIEAWYDPAGSGLDWTKLDSITVSEMSPKMTATNTFSFAIVGDTFYGPISEGEFWADDFRLTDLTPTAPHFEPVTKTGGTYQTWLKGAVDQIVIVDVSTDLVSWTSVQTNRMGVNGSIVEMVVNKPRQFFRARALSDGSTNTGPVTNSPDFMVWIAPGTFMMGSSSTELGHRSDEGPQTQVTITRGFWISQYEVTQEQYLSLMGVNPSWFTPKNGYADDLKRPVEQVSWNDATTYCQRLTTRERTAGQLPEGYVYRLPTEAEWIYCCRAGTTTATAFGNSLSSTQANFEGNYPYGGAAKGPYLGNPTKVGSYAPNAWGLHDMHGNVWEFCLDWHGTYPGGNITDPTGPSSGLTRVCHGGSYGGDGASCRTAYRYAIPPDIKDNSFGFRPVLAPE